MTAKVRKIVHICALREPFLRFFIITPSGLFQPSFVVLSMFLRRSFGVPPIVARYSAVLANPSRGCPWAFSFLRTLRGVVGTFVLVREAFARLPERFFSFASPSRASRRTFWPLRTLREVARAIFHARETFASLPEPSVTLAKPSPASPAEAASPYGSTSCSYSRWINYCITHSPVPMATSERKTGLSVRRGGGAALLVCHYPKPLSRLNSING